MSQVLEASETRSAPPRGFFRPPRVNRVRAAPPPPRGLPGWWPQGEIGVILWGLSAMVEDWQNAAALTALCTIPNDAIRWPRRDDLLACRASGDLHLFAVQALLVIRDCAHILLTGGYR